MAKVNEALLWVLEHSSGKDFDIISQLSIERTKKILPAELLNEAIQAILEKVEEKC